MVVKSASWAGCFWMLRKKFAKPDQQLLDMIQAQFTQGVATNDQLLVAQDQLTTSIAGLQTSLRDREQYEHALAGAGGCWLLAAGCWLLTAGCWLRSEAV